MRDKRWVSVTEGDMRVCVHALREEAEWHDRPIPGEDREDSVWETGPSVAF